MKKSPIVKALPVLLLILSLFVVQVSAAVDPAIQKTSSSSLIKLEIMKGDEKGNLNLSGKLRRCEFITFVIRMMGYDQETNTDEVIMTYKDMSKRHWAYNYIKIALKYKLVGGFSDNTIRPDAYLRYADAQTILIRALGYESALSGKWPDNVLSKSAELGLDRNINMPKDKEMTRGEASVLIYNALTIDYSAIETDIQSTTLE